MIVFTECPHCSSDYSEKTLCDTRAELAKEKGHSFDVTCHSCDQQFNIHLNDLRARKSRASSLAALIIFAISLPFAGIMFWQLGSSVFTLISLVGVILLPFIAYVLIHKQEQVRVSIFNNPKG
jgi:transposase-like protein